MQTGWGAKNHGVLHTWVRLDASRSLADPGRHAAQLSAEEADRGTRDGSQAVRQG
jgi:hypothetical protein